MIMPINKEITPGAGSLPWSQSFGPVTHNVYLKLLKTFQLFPPSCFSLFLGWFCDFGQHEVWHLIHA